jgi:hypothetical protein
VRRSSNQSLLTVGYVEQIDLPEWRVYALTAKLDTGALSSALHVENMSCWEDGWITFDVPLTSGARSHVEAELVRRGQVRSTNGKVEWRNFVSTRLCLGPIERAIEIGLVDRSSMNYRMLLGRTALAGGCTVDPARSFLL